MGFKNGVLFASVKLFYILPRQKINSNVTTETAHRMPGKLPTSDPEKTNCLIRLWHSAKYFNCHVYSYHLCFIIL